MGIQNSKLFQLKIENDILISLTTSIFLFRFAYTAKTVNLGLFRPQISIFEVPRSLKQDAEGGQVHLEGELLRQARSALR